MKKIFFLLVAVCATMMSWAQVDSVRVVRVSNVGNRIFQMPTSLMDSIKVSESNMANFFFGDGSWSCHIDNMDSISFGYVMNGDTTIVRDTTAIDTAQVVRIHWNGDSVEIENPHAESGIATAVDGGHVTVTAAAGTANVVYDLSGTSANGSFTLNTDKKFILRLDGVNLTSQNNKPVINIKDSKKGVVHVVENTENAFLDDASNTGKSCFYSKGELVFQGMGSMTVTSVGVNGIQGKDGVSMLAGNVNISVSGLVTRGIKTDGNMVMSAGNLTITSSGSLTIDTLEDGTFDMSYSAGIKPDGDFVMNGGNLTIVLPESNHGGRCVSTGGNVVINGGSMNLTTAGAGAAVGGTGTNARDGYACACIKSDSNIYIYGGRVSSTSTGLGGRGIVADGNLVVGREGEMNDKINVFVHTSGNPINAVSSGGPGGPGGPGQQQADYFKGLPKGIKIDGSIYIHSGHVASYCSQPSGDPTGEAIEAKDSIVITGGDIEANAYDDAINAGTYLGISGGRVWAYSRGNDGIDCNGTRTDITGGVILAKGNEVGIDAATDAGGHFYVTGGIIVTQGGRMGPWDTPNFPSTQRYIQVNDNGTNGLVVKNSQGEVVFVYKSVQFSGSGFIDEDGTNNAPQNGPGGPGGGGTQGNNIVISTPDIVAGSYTYFTSPTIDGGSSWHGYYTGSETTTTGNGTSVTAR